MGLGLWAALFGDPGGVLKGDSLQGTVGSTIGGSPRNRSGTMGLWAALFDDPGCLLKGNSLQV